MTRGQHHILHAGLPGQFRPFFRRPWIWREVLREPGVLLMWNLLGEHHPFAPARDGIDSEMNEHSESRLPPPGNSAVCLWAGTYLGQSEWWRRQRFRGMSGHAEHRARERG